MPGTFNGKTLVISATPTAGAKNCGCRSSDEM